MRKGLFVLFLALVLAAAGAMVGSAHADNLITNGDFSGSVTPYGISPDNYPDGWTPNPNNWPAAGGGTSPWNYPYNHVDSSNAVNGLSSLPAGTDYAYISAITKQMELPAFPRP